MDKKMRKVTKDMRGAVHDIKKGKFEEAKKLLKTAEKKNTKLADIDEKERDPKIHKFDKMKKELKECKKMKRK